MKIRVADYIADFFAKRNMKDVFTVVGGGAMYLNDAFGHHPQLRCTYVQHEQAAALAAEGYARVKEVPAIVCVTTGPGGTNAMTGVLCAYQDSIPMVIISGQVRYETTVESTGLNLRQFGEQEYKIIESVTPMTKYAKMIKDSSKIRYYLEKAYWYAMEGRKGPVWLDIPLNVQSAIVDVDIMQSFEIGISNYQQMNKEQVTRALQQAHRPLVLAGSGIRSSGMVKEFRELVYKLQIPVVAATSVADLLPNPNEFYFGNFGTFGGRAGNYIIQNSDLLLCLGCRMSFKQIGFNYQHFAPNAKKIVVDVDINELQKPTLDIDLPIYCNLQIFIRELLSEKINAVNMESDWLIYCRELKKKYPIYQRKFSDSSCVNQYFFINKLKKNMKKDSTIIVGNSVACVGVLQMGVETDEQRLFGNVNCGTMGYDLPASVGAARAKNEEVYCITGDGSIQMNLQELGTIDFYKLPVKIIIFNNCGYQAIVQTQTNYFNGRLSGCTKESGLGIPDFKKIANAYNLPYIRINTHDGLEEKVKWFTNLNGAAICEVMQDPSQNIEPKVQSRKAKDGTIYSPPLCDLFPFLEQDEHELNQYAHWRRDK